MHHSIIFFSPHHNLCCNSKPLYSTARVKKALKKDGTVVALKLVEKSILTALSEIKLRREIEAMDSCKHAFVTKLNDVDWNFLYPKKNGSKLACVLMELEFLEGGEFFNFLNYMGCFPEEIARTYFQQLVQGSVVHACKYISRCDSLVRSFFSFSFRLFLFNCRYFPLPFKRYLSS